MKRIAASLILAVAASSASALEFSGEMYVVGSIGRSGINQTEVQVNNNNNMWNSSATVPSWPNTIDTVKGLRSAQSSSRNGYKLQLGYEFTPNLAIEGGYINLGKTDYSATYSSQWASTMNPTVGLGIPVTGHSVAKSAEISGINAAAVMTYPVNPSFSAFAKLGVFYAKVKQTTTSNYSLISTADTDDSNAKAYYGVGGTYYPFKDRNFGIRAEYERFLKVGDAQVTGISDVGLTTVGISTKF